MYSPSALKADHKYGPVVAVHHERHIYPVTDPSIINSVAQRSIPLWDKDPTFGKVDPCRSSVTMAKSSKTHKGKAGPNGLEGKLLNNLATAVINPPNHWTILNPTLCILTLIV